MNSKAPTSGNFKCLDGNFTGTRKADVAKSTMTSTPRKNIDPDAPGPPPPPADMAFKMRPPETITHKEAELVIQAGRIHCDL